MCVLGHVNPQNSSQFIFTASSCINARHVCFVGWPSRIPVMMLIHMRLGTHCRSRKFPRSRHQVQNGGCPLANISLRTRTIEHEVHVVDVCHGSSFSRSRGHARQAGGTNQDNHVPPDPFLVPPTAALSGRCSSAGCHPPVVSDEPQPCGQSHGSRESPLIAEPFVRIIRRAALGRGQRNRTQQWTIPVRDQGTPTAQGRGRWHGARSQGMRGGRCHLPTGGTNACFLSVTQSLRRSVTSAETRSSGRRSTPRTSTPPRPW